MRKLLWLLTSQPEACSVVQAGTALLGFPGKVVAADAIISLMQFLHAVARRISSGRRRNKQEEEGGRGTRNITKTNGCFCELGVLFLGVLAIRLLLFGVYVGAADFGTPIFF